MSSIRHVLAVAIAANCASAAAAQTPPPSANNPATAETLDAVIVIVIVIVTATLEDTAIDFRNALGFGARATASSALRPGVLADSVTVSCDDAERFVRNIASSINEPGALEESLAQANLRWTPTEVTEVNAVLSWNKLDAPALYDQDSCRSTVRCTTPATATCSTAAGPSDPTR
ncbi:hypothetical protein [Silanimonas algicola]